MVNAEVSIETEVATHKHARSLDSSPEVVQKLLLPESSVNPLKPAISKTSSSEKSLKTNKDFSYYFNFSFFREKTDMNAV